MIDDLVYVLSILFSGSILIAMSVLASYIFYSCFQKQDNISSCPHGYPDWDDCPECRH